VSFFFGLCVVKACVKKCVKGTSKAPEIEFSGAFFFISSIISGGFRPVFKTCQALFAEITLYLAVPGVLLTDIGLYFIDTLRAYRHFLQNPMLRSSQIHEGPSAQWSEGDYMSVYEVKLKHDQSGRIAEKTETVKGKSIKWTYSYDKKGCLFEAHLDNRLVCQCHYDRDGRRQQDYFPRTHGSQLRNYHYRMDNRLQQAGNNGYTHDKQGFRSIWNHEGKYTLYKYAPDYRLLKVEIPDDKVIFEFAHDEDGQREYKYRNGEVVEAYKWLDFVRLAGFHDGEAGYRFAYDGDERTPYAMQREDGVVAYLYYDQVGSLRVVADKSGNVIKEVLYDPFGGIIEDSNPDLRIPIGFAGGLHDRDLGFVRFGWRDYDTFPAVGPLPIPWGMLVAMTIGMDTVLMIP